jgi:outer membrane protein assembly factor BamB
MHAPHEDDAMRRGLLAISTLLALVGSARALIDKPYPLKAVLAESQLVFVARVDSLDPDKPAAVLAIDEDLKGKAAFRRLPVNLTGDADAVKSKQTPQLLKRLAPKLPVIVFATERDKGYFALCYTNGTWFLLRGEKDDDKVRWSFNHFEPYLRRTFKGTTEEMKQTVADAIANKKDPPDVDKKEKPGIGPEVKADKETGRQGAKEEESSTSPKRKQGAHGASQQFAMFAVIPSVLIGGPLAVLAMLFPTVFGGWKRWLALISVACTISTLYFLQWLFPNALANSWWGTPQALWLGMMLTILLGTLWAWLRQMRRVESGESQAVPSRVEFVLLAILSIIGLGLLAVRRASGGSLLDAQWLPVLILAGGAVPACLYVFRARWTESPKPSILASELVMLSGMAFVCAILGVWGESSARAHEFGPVVQGEGQRGTDTHVVTPGRLVWTFRAPDKGGISSSPLVDGDRIYVAAAHDSVFQSYGALYCLDRMTGTEVWTFHDDKKMKPVFSSPCIADGKLYIGEGFHQDSNCKLYCLRADTGAKVWEFPTGSHTESSPCVADGKVYCGAGDDGLYCLDAATGKEVWHFPGFHVDAGPTVADGRVFFGSGVGDIYKDTVLFCLDATTGNLVWRLPTSLPAWATPTVKGPHAYFGIGNGRMNESDSNPAGALLCVDVSSGTELWRYPVGDGVLGRPVAGGNFVYFGSRDGNLYCLHREKGQLAWKNPLGAPIVSAPAVARCNFCGARTSVFAVASDGSGLAQLVCLGANEGQIAWSFDIAAHARTSADLWSSPALTVGPQGRRIYVGAQINSTARGAVLYCFEDQIDRDVEPKH